MKSAARLLILIFPFALFAAEQEQVPAEWPSSETAPAIEFHPRAAGAIWIYDGKTFDKDGRVLERFSSSERVIGSLEIEGITAFRIKHSSRPPATGGFLMGLLNAFSSSDADPYYFWEYSGPEGSYQVDEDLLDGKPPSLEDLELTMRFPVEAGTTYEAHGDIWTVLAVDKEITVPAGTFKTVVYQTGWDEAGEAFRDRYYQAPGVGLVKWVTEELIDGEFVVFEIEVLRRYRLAGDEEFQGAR